MSQVGESRPQTQIRLLFFEGLQRDKGVHGGVVLGLGSGTACKEAWFVFAELGTSVFVLGFGAGQHLWWELGHQSSVTWPRGVCSALTPSPVLPE